jgi:hypothetical protein
MIILNKIIFSIAIAFSLVSLIDFTVYSIRSSPKSQTLNYQWWFIGFLSSIYVIYRVLP